jgi:hypothetical protein
MGNSLWYTSVSDYKHVSRTDYARNPRFYCKLYLQVVHPTCNWTILRIKLGGIKLRDVIKRNLQSHIQAVKTKWLVYIPIGLTIKFCILHTHTHTYMSLNLTKITVVFFYNIRRLFFVIEGHFVFPEVRKESSLIMSVNFIVQRLHTDILVRLCFASVITKLQVRMFSSLTLLLLTITLFLLQFLLILF